MFRLYYIDDLPWYKVAMRMNEMFPNRRIKYTEDQIVNRNIKDILINCKNVTQCHGEKWYYDSGESQQSLTTTYT